MHALHTVLLSITDVLEDWEIWVVKCLQGKNIRELGEAQKKAVEVFAKRITDRACLLVRALACPRACDYFSLAKRDLPENCTGGCLLGVFPEFKEELEKAIKAREEVVLELARECFDEPLDVAGVERLLKDDGDMLLAHKIKKIGQLLCGDWVFEALFFSGPDLSSRPSARTMRRVSEAPHEFALVFFDFHD